MFKCSKINSKITPTFICHNKPNNLLIIKNYKNKYSGFTLIELLVVIAIIGILASIVLSSLNTARIKGVEVAIKSNLKNMIPQAELAYINDYSNVCADTKIVSMITSINNTGATAKCFSYTNGTTETYTRWGVSVKNSDGTKNWSVDNSGVVDWYAADSSASAMNWTTAIATCAASGGHLPTVDQLRALYLVYGDLVYGEAPPTFQTSSYYWSSMADSADSSLAYLASMHSASVYDYAKTNTYWVRCVH